MKTIKTLLFFFIIVIVAYYLKYNFFTRYVNAEKMVARNLVHSIFGVGYVGAEVISDVASQISGKIDRINFIEGQQVNSGEVLVKLDDSELKCNLESACINNQKATANIDLIKLNLSKINKDIELASSNCEKTKTIVDYNKKELERFIKLMTSNSTAEQTYDNKKMAYTVSEKEYNNSLINLQLLEIEKEKQLISQKLSILEAENSKSSMNAAQLKIDFTEVKSPFDGIIIKRLVEEGMAVNIGNPLIRIAKKGSYWVSAYVDITQMSNVKIGQNALIALNRTPNAQYNGKVYRIEQQGDKITEELKVDIIFQTIPQNLYLDEKAEISIEAAARENANSIHSKCIINQNKETGVYVLSNEKAVYKKVTAGITDINGFTEILNGLNDSDVIISAEDISKISSNDKITIKSKE